MFAHAFISSLRWIRSQIVGILLAIIAILMAAVYAAPYSPSAFGYAKYDVSCAVVSNDTGNDQAICVRIDTTTGESSCRYAYDVSNNWGAWTNCHQSTATPSDRNPW